LVSRDKSSIAVLLALELAGEARAALLGLRGLAAHSLKHARQIAVVRSMLLTLSVAPVRGHRQAEYLGERVLRFRWLDTGTYPGR
jgi:hypothetical protein